MQELHQHWPSLVEILGTKSAWPHGVRPGFLPDFGLTLRKAGLDRDEDGRKYFQIFDSVPLQFLSKIEDNLYSLTAPYIQEYAPGQFSAMMLTFDFDTSVYQQLLISIPSTFKERIQRSLSRQPYKLLLESTEAPLVMVAAEPGDVVHENEDESYCPFIAEEFISAEE